MNDIKKYLDIVCEQIRFEKAHDFVKKELQDHILDQRDALIEQGMEEQTAVQKAIEEMGDPVFVGTELDRVHRPKWKWEYIVFVVFFSFINLVTRFIVQQNNPISYYERFVNGGTILSLFIGIAVMIAVCYIDFTILANNSKLIYMVYLMTMIVLQIYLNLFGAFFNGVLAYIDTPFGFVKFPALIYLFPIILIGLLYDCRGKSYQAILLCGASFLPPAFLALGKGDNAAILVVALVSVILIFASIIKGWFSVNKSCAFLLFLILMIILTIYLAFRISYFQYRLMDIYIDLKYYATIGNDTLKRNVKGASLLGMGELFYTKKEEYVQLPILLGRDYFTAYVLYYGGWIIFALLLGIYLFFIIRGFLLARKQKSQLGSMTAFAVLLTFFFVTIWNIAVNSGYFIDFNPLEIPFFCYSGSANIMFFILMGMLLSVFRNGKYTQDILQKKSSPIQFKNGVLTIHLKK